MKTEQQIEKEIRTLRQNMFNLATEDEQDKAGEQIAALKKELHRVRQGVTVPVGRYSGLTRQELARTGTCEPDWF